MRLVLGNPLDPLVEVASIELKHPGCILGSSSDADFRLRATTGTPEIGRIQAIVRKQNQLCTLENISLACTAQVNGRPLGLRQTVTLQIGDALSIGDHVLTLQASTPKGADNQAAASPPVGEEAQDLFSSLLGGPGVIPVGSPIPPAADGAQTDILTDTRPTLLNHIDPLAQQAQRDDISAVLDDNRTQTADRMSNPLNSSW